MRARRRYQYLGTRAPPLEMDNWIQRRTRFHPGSGDVARSNNLPSENTEHRSFGIDHIYIDRIRTARGPRWEKGSQALDAISAGWWWQNLKLMPADQWEITRTQTIPRFSASHSVNSTDWRFDSHVAMDITCLE